MKNLPLYLSLTLLLLASVHFTSPDRPRLTSSEPATMETVDKDGPAHPGWHEQWRLMRQNEDGVVPPDYLKDVYARESQRWSAAKTTAGLLSNVALLGPDNVGGRTRALIIDINNHDHILAGGISGGVWQSFDRGVTWTPTNDQAQSMAVTSLSQDPNQPGDIYFSTGEVRGNSAGISGLGVFKSTDGGLSFSQLPATTGSSFSSTWRVQVSPSEPGRVYVATRSGGLQRSTDGGATFSMVFGITNGMEVSDVEVFADSSVLIGVRTQGVFYSPSGDQGSFVPVSSGLPATGFRRVELAYCDSAQNIVYALYEDDNGSDALGLWKSTDQGQSWAAMTNPENTINFSFPWYCMLLAVQPDNPDFVIAAGQQIAHSVDGGSAWTTSANSHADYHSAVFDRDNSQLVLIGNDGGIWKYGTLFMTGSPLDLNDGYSTTQFYAGALFPQDDVMGGTQDNGTHVSRSGNTTFNKLMGGDGAYCAVNQQNPNVCYASFQNGQIRKSSNAQALNPNFSNVVNQLDGDTNGSIDEGAWFINPFDINLADGEQLYFVTLQRLWRTTDAAANWAPATSDLRAGNDNPYCVGVSRDLNPTVYVGGESGLLYRVDNANTAAPGGETDLSATVPGAISGHFVSSVQVHPQDASVIYVTFSSISSQPRVWKVTGANTSAPVWTSISGDLPASLPANWIGIDPGAPDSVLLAATDYGLYTTTNGGQNWALETDVPNSPVFQVKVRDADRKVFAFTHGRGIWQADLPTIMIGTDQNVEEAFAVYPNPAQNELRIRVPQGNFEGKNYEIRGIDGKILRGGSLENDFLDLSGMPSGLYFLRVWVEEKAYVRQFVKL